MTGVQTCALPIFVFWSEKYAKRAKAEREAALAKARDLAKNPGNYIRATSYGAAKYVKK